MSRFFRSHGLHWRRFNAPVGIQAVNDNFSRRIGSGEEPTPRAIGRDEGGVLARWQCSRAEMA
jgi:hypothetical protein